MSDFDWVEDIPSPHDLGDHYKNLKLLAAEEKRYEDAAKYRDLEREVLGLPEFDSNEAWAKIFKELTESGEMLQMLRRLGEAYGQR